MRRDGRAGRGRRLRRRSGVRRAHRRSAAGAGRARRVVVLEARDRVGGRIWTQQRESGATVDRGGGWLAPKHDAAHAPGGRDGRDHLQDPRRRQAPARRRRHSAAPTRASSRRSARSPSPRSPGRSGRSTGSSKQVPLEAPWTAAKAAEWDATSVGEYLETHRHPHRDRARPVRDGDPRAAHRRPPRGVAAQPADARARPRQPRDAVLHRGRRAGEPRGRRRRADGAADGRRARSTRVHLQQPGAVDHPAARQRGRHAARRRHRARAPASWSPCRRRWRSRSSSTPRSRTTARRSTAARWPDRSPRRCVVYDEPFWRADGFSGQTAEPGSASEVTIDASPADGRVRRPRVVHLQPRGRAVRRPARRPSGASCVLDAAHRAARAEGGVTGRLRRDGLVARGVDPRLLDGPLQARHPHAATATCSASRGAGSTGPAPRPRPPRTAPSTAPSAPASARQPRSSTATRTSSTVGRAA